MTREMKINFLVVPISLGIVLITSIILAICGQAWIFYLIGALVGLMDHSLRVKQNARITRFAKLDPNHIEFNPKKSAILWYILRFVLTIGVFAVLLYYSKVSEEKKNAIKIVLALCGYLTSKIVFVICLFTVKDTEADKEAIKIASLNKQKEETSSKEFEENKDVEKEVINE